MDRYAQRACRPGGSKLPERLSPYHFALSLPFIERQSARTCKAKPCGVLRTPCRTCQPVALFLQGEDSAERGKENGFPGIKPKTYDGLGSSGPVVSNLECVQWPDSWKTR